MKYIDLYLIHWPGCKTGWPLKKGTKSPPDWTPAMRNTGTWRAMEQLFDEGKVRAIGVSNYSIRHLKELLKTCRVRPAVNQVEFHPWLVQSDLLEFCKKEGIILQAYASIGSGDVSSRADFFSLPPVIAAAKAHDKTSAQILLRWALEKGVHVIPKSKSVDRMVENFGVFDFKLSPEQVAAIDHATRDIALLGNMWILIQFLNDILDSASPWRFSEAKFDAQSLFEVSFAIALPEEQI